MILHGNNFLRSMKKSSVPRAQRFMYFQILCYALERWDYEMLSGRTRRGSKVHHNTELRTQLMVSQWNSSGIISQNSSHCSSATKSKSSCQKWSNSQKKSQDGSSSCRCSTGHVLLWPAATLAHPYFYFGPVLLWPGLSAKVLSSTLARSTLARSNFGPNQKNKQIKKKQEKTRKNEKQIEEKKDIRGGIKQKKSVLFWWKRRQPKAGDVFIKTRLMPFGV